MAQQSALAPAPGAVPAAATTREERIGALAAGQHGLVTRRQLLELGVSRNAIGRRLESRRLRAVHGGIYLVGPIEPDQAIEMAAVLAGGATAALSHTSALRLWGMLRSAVRRPVHVTVSGGGRSRRPGIVFHRVKALPEDECATLDGIRITSPARTIIDAAGLIGTREIELAVAFAEREGLIPDRALAGLLERYPRRSGSAVLRRLTGAHDEAHLTRSVAERKCRELLRKAGLPQPHSNVGVGPYQLDIFWPEENVAVEVDGWQFHGSRAHIENDRQKDNWLRARGIEVVRLTWRQITREPLATAVVVGQALALARARRQAPPGPTGLTQGTP